MFWKGKIDHNKNIEKEISEKTISCRGFRLIFLDKCKILWKYIISDWDMKNLID